MNAITPVNAHAAGAMLSEVERGSDLLYAPNDPIFAAAGPTMLGQGWSVWPQERTGRRMPARILDETLHWGAFQARHATADEMALWCREAPRANVACALGPASGHTFALDVDCLDAAVSERVQAIAAGVLGPTPLVRIGRAPKAALVYRYDEGGPPRSRAVHLEGHADCALEVLGAGRALTLHGLHHVTGRWFHWPVLNPLSSPPEHAPEVGAAAVEQFMQAVEAEFLFVQPPARAWTVSAAPLSGSGMIVRPSDIGGPEGAKLTDGREAYLRNLAWDLVRRNAPALTAAHAEGRIEEAAGSIVAAALEVFEAACVMSGRWTASFLRAQATDKVSSAVAKLLAGDMLPKREVAPQAVATAPQPVKWADYLDLDSVLAAPPPPLDFVLPGILAGTLAVLVSPGGAGKSMLALGLGACVAAGRTMWGLLPADPVAGSVLVVSAEDPKPILAHRLHALAHVPGGTVRLATDAGFRERFRVKAVQGTGFGLGTWTNAGFQPSPAFEVLRQEVAELRPRLVVLDTLNRCLAGIPENDNAALGRVVSELEAMVAPVGAACLVLHHVSKGAAREGAGDEQQAARGAGAITDNARWQGNLVGLTREDAEAHGIDEENRRRWVRWATSKNNYGVSLPDRWLWRDQGGVLRARELPEPPKRTVAESKGRARRGYDTD